MKRGRMKRTAMKVSARVTAGVLAGFALGAMMILSSCTMIGGVRDLLAMEIHTPADLADIADGAYAGGWDAGMVRTSVMVSMAGGRISRVEIVEHECGRGKPAEAIVEDIVKEQSLEIDTVSGATVSSKAILKSVDMALNSAPRR